ncbi:MAG TPA: T9SS type A sorting domain-containing protein, partial [Segetibacter sp.]
VTGLKVYPNPIASVATVSIQPTESGIVTVTVFDAQARPVLSILNGYVEKNTNKKIAFNAGNLPNGMYFIRYSSAGKVISEKIVIAR